MTTWTVLYRAFRNTARSWRLVLLLWIANLLLSIAAIQPLAQGLSQALDHSVMARDARDLLPGVLAVDIGESLEDVAPAAGRTLLVAVVLSGLLHILSLGGLLGRLSAIDKGGDGYPTFAGFMSDCGRYAWRATRLTLLGGVLTGGALLSLGLLNRLLQRLTRDSLYESPKLWLDLAFLVTALVLLVAVRAIVDSARADMFLEERRTMRRALVEGILHVVRCPGPALVAYATAGATALGLFACVIGLRFLLPEEGTVGIVFAAILGQIAMTIRISGIVATTAVALHARGDLDYRDRWSANRVRVSRWGN